MSTAIRRCSPFPSDAENLGVSLAHAKDKLAQLDECARRAMTITLDIPTFGEITGRTASLPT
jgi:hypothetical protein